MQDGDALHQMARMALTNGKLPGRPSDRMWAGMGSGVRCSVCETSIEPDEADWELEFARRDHGVDTYHVHISCFGAWERARKELNAGDASTRLSELADPVKSAVVGRAETSGARSR